MSVSVRSGGLSIVTIISGSAGIGIGTSATATAGMPAPAISRNVNIMLTVLVFIELSSFVRTYPFIDKCDLWCANYAI
jgi:hypothetical protein